MNSSTGYRRSEPLAEAQQTALSAFFEVLPARTAWSGVLDGCVIKNRDLDDETGGKEGLAPASRRGLKAGEAGQSEPFPPLADDLTRRVSGSHEDSQRAEAESLEFERGLQPWAELLLDIYLDKRKRQARPRRDEGSEP